IREFEPTVTQGVNALVQGILNDRRKLKYLGPQAFQVANEMAANRDSLLPPIPSGRCHRVVFSHQVGLRLQYWSGPSFSHCETYAPQVEYQAPSNGSVS